MNQKFTLFWTDEGVFHAGVGSHGQNFGFQRGVKNEAFCSTPSKLLSWGINRLGFVFIFSWWFKLAHNCIQVTSLNTANSSPVSRLVTWTPTELLRSWPAPYHFNIPPHGWLTHKSNAVGLIFVFSTTCTDASFHYNFMQSHLFNSRGICTIKRKRCFTISALRNFPTEHDKLTTKKQ